MSMFMVVRARGPAWDKSKPLRAQPNWDEHARFMEQLLAEGLVLFGGFTRDDDKVLLVMEAKAKSALVHILEQDIWHRHGMLTLERVARWDVLLDFRQPG
jgi:hypothetical protein